VRRPAGALHDDAHREFAYTSGAERALKKADTSGWTVVSMKDDFAEVFEPMSTATRSQT
jgi:hypothetical protein